MAGEVDAIWVATEACGVSVGPGDRAPYLLSHRKQAAARLVDGGEIQNNVVRPGPNEQLGLHGIVGRSVATPGAAMDEDVDRSMWLGGAKYIEPLNFAR